MLNVLKRCSRRNASSKAQSPVHSQPHFSRRCLHWIQFPYGTYKQWEDCKDPRCYNLPNNTYDSDLIILRELLIFIAQRSLLDLATCNEGVLETFVGAVRGHLDDDNRFVGLTDYQFLLSPFHFSPEEVNTTKDVVAVAVRNAC